MYILKTKYLWICVVPLKCNNILLECLLSNNNGDRLFRHMPLGVATNKTQYTVIWSRSHQVESQAFKEHSEVD